MATRNNLQRMRSVLGKTQTRIGNVLAAPSGGKTRVSVIGGGEVEVSALDPKHPDQHPRLYQGQRNEVRGTRAGCGQYRHLRAKKTGNRQDGRRPT